MASQNTVLTQLPRQLTVEQENTTSRDTKASAISIVSKVSSDEVTARMTDADRIALPGRGCCGNDAFFGCWPSVSVCAHKYPERQCWKKSKVYSLCSSSYKSHTLKPGAKLFSQVLKSVLGHLIKVWIALGFGSGGEGCAVSVWFQFCHWLPLCCSCGGCRKMFQALIRAEERAEIFHSCSPCIHRTILLLATLFWALRILAKVRNKAFSPWYFIYLTYYFYAIRLFQMVCSLIIQTSFAPWHSLT